MAYHHVLVALLGAVLMLNAYGAPREVDAREARALCQDATVYYPVEAQKVHAEGRAVVDIVLDTSGTVREVKLTKSSGSVVLDDSAVQAAWTIRCTPFRDPESGAITMAHFLKPFVFRLVN